MIKINNLQIFDKNKKICEVLDLSLNYGEIKILSGVSGSGKTSILRVISKENENYCGEIFIDNINIKNICIKEYSKKVGYLNQTYDLFLNMNIFDQLYLTMILNGFNKEDVIININKMLNDFKLDLIKNKWPNEISGGQRQKIAFIKRILLKPRFILLDEPSSALDLESKKIIIEKINEYKNNYNVGFLISSHDLDFINMIEEKNIYKI
jgi:ABC-type multidrug transport system ATPase subunit